MSRIQNIMGALGNVTTGAMAPVYGNMGPMVVQWQGWTTLSLIGCMLIALVAELAPPYMVMMGTLIIFLPLGILNIEEAFHGFSDEAMLSVAVLFVVAKGEYLEALLSFRMSIKSGSSSCIPFSSMTFKCIECLSMIYYLPGRANVDGQFRFVTSFSHLELVT